MSIETVNNPGYEPQTAPAKSGRGWFTCIGIGCVVLLFLCGVGAVLTWIFAGDQIRAGFDNMQIQAENLALAKESELVKEKLGEPIEQVFEILIPETRVEGDVPFVKSKVKLKGPEGEGYLVSEVRMKPGEKVEQTQLYLEFDGEQFDLTNLEELGDLDIEEGFEEDSTDETIEEEPVAAGNG